MAILTGSNPASRIRQRAAYGIQDVGKFDIAGQRPILDGNGSFLGCIQNSVKGAIRWRARAKTAEPRPIAPGHLCNLRGDSQHCSFCSAPQGRPEKHVHGQAGGRETCLRRMHPRRNGGASPLPTICHPPAGSPKNEFPCPSNRVRRTSSLKKFCHLNE